VTESADKPQLTGRQDYLRHAVRSVLTGGQGRPLGIVLLAGLLAASILPSVPVLDELGMALFDG
jgi:hypothetical protein